MNNIEAVEFATRALFEWGVADGAPRLIKNRENAVFEVTGPEGSRAALRLHRPDYQTDDAIRSELIWSEALYKAGLQLPQPIPTRNGKLTVLVADAGRLASMVSWIDGVPLGEGGEDFIWDDKTQISLYSSLGSALAQLHRLSDSFNLPASFTRPRLDCDGLLGESPLWNRFWENPVLDPAEADLLLAARARLVDMLAGHDASGADFGLIHADALRENVLVDSGRITLIDFDDGVFGYRMYELGVAMSQNWELANAADLARALLDGYQAQRPLPNDAEALLPAFVMLRTLASCGWTISRYGADDPTLIDYAQRAVRAADRYLSGRPFFEN